MTVDEYLGNYTTDGSSYGRDTSEKISFYGVTPIVQRSGSTQNKVATTAITACVTTAAVAITSTSTGAYGFSDSTSAASYLSSIQNLITQSAANMVLVNELRAALTALGLIKGSA